jgi:Ca2+-dependent lipid-binding protein
MPPETQNSNPQTSEPEKQESPTQTSGDTEPSTQSTHPAYQPPVNGEKIQADNTPQIVPSAQNIKNKHYNKSGSKVIDFLIGFFAPGVVIYILSMIAPFLFTFFYVFIIAIIILIIAFFMIGRRYIAIGMLISCVVIPLIVFGSCMLMFANFKA